MTAVAAVLAAGCAGTKAAGDGPRPARRQVPREVFTVGDLQVRSLLGDGDVVWAGTTSGIIRHDTRSGQATMIDRSNSNLLSYGIIALRKLDNRLWVGTYGGGLSLYDGTTWAHYGITHGLGDAFVYDMARAPNGDVWIATWSGANRVARGALDDKAAWATFTVESTGGGLPNDWVYAVAVDAKGVVWFATEGGLARYDGATWKHWTHDDGLGAPYERVMRHLEKVDRSIASEHHGWAGSGEGDQGRAGGQDQKGRRSHGPGGGEADSVEGPIAYNPNYIVSLLLDSKGRVLCGTWGGGLSVFKEDRFIASYTTGEGLPGNYVTALQEAPDGTLWIGTSQGLSKVPGGDFARGFTNFGAAEGLPMDRIFAILLDEKQTPWVGGTGAAVHFLEIP